MKVYGLIEPQLRGWALWGMAFPLALPREEYRILGVRTQHAHLVLFQSCISIAYNWCPAGVNPGGREGLVRGRLKAWGGLSPTKPGHATAW